MDTDQDVAVGVDLQEVPVHGVKHEAPEQGRGEISEEVCGSLFHVNFELQRGISRYFFLCLTWSGMKGHRRS